LKQLGVKNVVFPEKDMGHRVAHMVSGESLDYVPIDEDFVMVKAEAPEAFNGQNLADLKIRSTHGVTVVATSKGDGQYQPAFPETIIETGDVLVVAGQTRQVDKFCSIA
jgi:trk system potassium uptake protein TrkA